MRKPEVCIKARSPPASLAVTGQVTKYTTVKKPIVFLPGKELFRDASFES